MSLATKSVLVTGADGFIGSHLVEALIEQSCHVKAFVFYNTFNSYGWLEELPSDKKKAIEFVSGDVRDYKRVSNAVQGVDIIFHLAALIGIPYSYAAPESYIDTNVKGALNVLQSALDCKVERVLMTSTSEVYGTALTNMIEETHPRQAQSPYAASKIAADSLSEAFYRSFGLPVSIVRPFNTYGPRQSARAVIPTVITQLLSGEKNIKLGDLSPMRDFVYVKDTVNGFLKIAESEKTIGEEINIATAAATSIENLVKNIVEMINPKAQVLSDASRMRPEKSEVYRLLGSYNKIKNLTGWEPSYALAEGLRETIEWFKIEKNLKIYKSHIYNV